jgi:hypothetical protein
MHNPATEVPESSTSYLKVVLRDSLSALVNPFTLHYEIRCLTTNRLIRALTPWPSPTAKTTIKLTSDDNALQVPTNARERRSVTVIANMGLDDQLLDEFRYAVLNSRSHPA